MKKMMFNENHDFNPFVIKNPKVCFKILIKILINSYL